MKRKPKMTKKEGSATENRQSSASWAPTQPAAGASLQSQIASLFSGMNLGTDPLNVIKGFTVQGSKVVRQAATVLEEEIASGIKTVKKMEQKLIKSVDLDMKKQDHLVQKFRNDSHDVIDIFLDLVEATLKGAEVISSEVIKLKQPNEPIAAGPKKSDLQFPHLVMPTPGKARETIKVTMTLENSEKNTTGTFRLLTTDLLASSGDVIKGRNISFKPKTISIPPQKQQKVEIAVRIPAGTPIGNYSGLIQATRIGQLHAVLTVQVVR